MKRTCKQCQREFELTDGEIKFYREKNLELPRRCKECRKVNQQNAKQGKTNGKNNFYSDFSGNNRNMKSGKGKIGILGVMVAFCLIFIFAVTKPDFISEIFELVDSGQDSSYTVPVSTIENTEEQENQDTKQTETPQDTQSKKKQTDKPKDTKSKKNQTEKKEEETVEYYFRNEKLLNQHFQKHGGEFSYSTAEEYEAGANRVIKAKNALHKKEREDNDDVYYLQETNEFVIVSTDGYIRTYFKPSGGINYYNRQ